MTLGDIHNLGLQIFNGLKDHFIKSHVRNNTAMKLKMKEIMCLWHS